MIDTSAWKEFRVGDYFHGIRGTSRKMQELNEGKTPVIAAARYNQGIAGYYDVPSEYENAITISCNGVGCGSTYYHDYPFAITGDAIVLDNIGNVPIGALHFIATVYDVYFSRKYSYTDKCSADKAEAEHIALPATLDGQPDWDYMESYMKAVMEESEKSLENLKKANDTKHLIDRNTWKEFRVGDYFIQERGKEKAPKQNKDGDCPLIQETNSNNGFDRLVQPTVIFKGNAITISINYASNVFYQKDDFCASVNIAIIRNDNLNLYNGYFIASVLSSAHRKFDYQNKISKELIDDEIIELPATSTGEPDWQYMEDYMKQIMDKSEQIISDLQIGA